MPPTTKRIVVLRWGQYQYIIIKQDDKNMLYDGANVSYESILSICRWIRFAYVSYNPTISEERRFQACINLTEKLAQFI